MDLVVDIQCYKNFENTVCPKEVAIISLDGDFVAHWVPVHRLSRSVKRENNWLTQHHHGLDYLDGDVTNKNLDR